MEAQKRRKPYPTDLKDKEWAKIEHLIPQPKSGGRPGEYERREILNVLFYMTKAGCAWRMLPHDLPPWEVVYMYFSQWQDEGVFERINEVLRKQIRIEEGKDEEPSAAIVDSQSVKTAEKGGLTTRLATMPGMLGRRSKAESDTSS